MASLLSHENGRILLGVHDAVHPWKQIRQHYQIPRGRQGNAVIWLYHRPACDERALLNVFLNGKRQASLHAKAMTRTWQWTALPVRISTGKLVVELRNNNGTWDVGFQPTPHSSHAEVSFDQGAHWVRNASGTSASLSGDYLVRLSIEQGRNPRLPLIHYATESTARMQAIRGCIPADIRRLKRGFRQVVALRSWICSLWSHQVDPSSYTPWDPFPIVSRAAEPTPGGTAICVHFGALLCAMAQSLGYKARCIAVTPDINSALGHFMTEIWDESTNAWALHDPNFDLHYKAEKLMGAIDLAECAHSGTTLQSLVRIGDRFPRKPKTLLQYYREHVLPGGVFRHMAVWPRNDFPVHPEQAPPSHGATAYCETEWIWYSPGSLGKALGMFPYHVSNRDFFIAAPD